MPPPGAVAAEGLSSIRLIQQLTAESSRFPKIYIICNMILPEQRKGGPWESSKAR
jgi:hypothetical protein